MAELYENKEAARERVILIGVCTRENENVEESLDELKELADTAGAEAVGRVIQNRESMHPGTYIGSGKIDEVRELAGRIARGRASSATMTDPGPAARPGTGAGSEGS